MNEYSGIEYNSVMYEKGYNLAIFDPELFECINTEVYRIENVLHIIYIRLDETFLMLSHYKIIYKYR